MFESIAERKTFAIAANRAAKGKRERPEVCNFFSHLEQNLNNIVSLLRANKFRFSEYQKFFVRDTKSRLINAPRFADRVVHHAIIARTGQVFESGAMHHSYACRIDRGHHAALKQAQKWSRTGDWFLKLDVEKFYDSVDHDHLRLMLRRRFAEARLLTLFDHLLDSYEVKPGKGLPIGALTSQYLSNFYLDTVDRWAKQTIQIKRYARYMDDMVFWGTKLELRRVLREVGPFLESMKLGLNCQSQLNRCELGLPFLGFVVYPDRIRLNDMGKRRLRRKLRNLEQSFVKGDFSEMELQERAQSLFAHAAVADDIGWRREVTKFTLCRES